MSLRAKRNNVQQRDISQHWFQCDYCEKSFSRKENLQSHVFTHTGERPFQCVQCDKKYTSYNGLKQHTKLHGKVKCYKCKKCSKRFRSPFAFRKHEKSHHDIYYTCSICTETFSTRVALNMHGCPLECEFCGKWFKLYIALSSHIEEEHLPISTNLEFLAEEGHAIDNLTDVLKEETEVKVFKYDKLHVCRICGWEFSDEVSLTFHVNIHAGGDPRECMVCGATFRTEVIRTYHHMRQHAAAIDWENLESGEKIFKQICGALDRNS